ncbi:hypothetical protein ES703_32715 [subsurface metagenome]
MVYIEFCQKYYNYFTVLMFFKSLEIDLDEDFFYAMECTKQGDDLIRYLEKDIGAVIIAEEINSVYWDELETFLTFLPSSRIPLNKTVWIGKGYFTRLMKHVELFIG